MEVTAEEGDGVGGPVLGERVGGGEAQAVLAGFVESEVDGDVVGDAGGGEVEGALGRNGIGCGMPEEEGRSLGTDMVGEIEVGEVLRVGRFAE